MQAYNESPLSARQWLPGLLISLTLLGLLLWLVEWRAMVAALATLNLPTLLAALLCYFAAALLRALSWHSILQKRVGLVKVFFVLQEGYLLNNLFPFRLGDVARAFLISRSHGGNPLAAFATIVIERLYDVALAAALLLATLPFVFDLRQTFWFASGVLGATLLLFVAIYWLIRYQTSVARLLQPFWQRSPQSLQKLSLRLVSVLQGFAIFQRPTQIASSFLWMLLSWLCLGGEYYLILRQFVPDAALTWAFFALAAGMLGGAIPSAPSGIGVYEAAVVGALAVVQVPFATAFSFALVIHLIHIAISSLLGLYALAGEGETLLGLYRKVLGVAH